MIDTPWVEIRVVSSVDPTLSAAQQQHNPECLFLVEKPATCAKRRAQLIGAKCRRVAVAA